MKPFDRQHPVRAFFDDPRIGAHGSHAFHFGIDIAAPDGTPVYSVEPGTVYFDSGRAIAVVAPDRSHSFGYWHIIPLVKSHEFVQRHQLLGVIDHGWGHVHFAETRDGHYVNPLRPGALEPYLDRVAPTITAVSITRDGSCALAIAEAYDTPPLPVPGRWAGEPVTPALLQYRLDHNQHLGAWQTACDFRTRLLNPNRFNAVYAPATRQNHQSQPGAYWFWLTQTWTPSDGSYTLQVRATDTAGNQAQATITLLIAADALAH
jgi:hypothetical protein